MENKDPFSCIVNPMVADDLAMEAARASLAMAIDLVMPEFFVFQHHLQGSFQFNCFVYMRPANDRRRCIVMLPIGWVHAQNYSCT